MQTTRVVVLLILASAPFATTAQTRLYVQRGSTLTIEGSNNLHTWKAQTSEPHGWIEFRAGFPGTTPPLGDIPARMEGSIPIRSLHINEGSAFDRVMYGLLQQEKEPLMRFRLIQLNLKSVPENNQQPFLFDSQIELIVAGVTNQISMPLQIFPLEDHKLRITGAAPLKLSAFNITPFEFPLTEPPGSKVTYRNDIDVSFEWLIGPKDPTRE